MTPEAARAKIDEMLSSAGWIVPDYRRFQDVAKHAGADTLDMIVRCRDSGLKAPEFRQDSGSFIQTLWRPVQVIAEPATAQATGQATVQDKELWFSRLRSVLSPTGQAAPQVTPQLAAALVAFFVQPRTSKEIQDFLGLRHRETFLDNYLTPMLAAGWLERTIPDKPTSPNQKYRLTASGQATFGVQQHPKT